MEITYCINDGPLFGRLVDVLNGREVDDRPRSVNGKQDSSACSPGSLKN